MKTDYKKLIKDNPDYNFLYENEHLGNNIIILGLGGSHAYGTNIPTSDLDIRGIAIEKPEELIGYQKFEQFINEKTDTTIFAFNKMIQLLMQNNPNIVEIIGLNPDQYLYVSKLGQELLDHKDLFLSKRCKFTFGGYAKANLKRLQNALARDNYPEKEKNEHISVSLQSALTTFNNQHNTEINPAFAYVDETGKLRFKLDIDIESGEFEDFYATVSNTTRNYKELLNRNRKKDDAHLNKHAMHLVRLLSMCIEMLETGEVHTYREKDHDLLMDIRNGKYMDENGNMTKEFYDMVDSLDKKMNEAYENSKLPEKPDMKKIEEWVMSANKRIINGEFKDEKFEL